MKSPAEMMLAEAVEHHKVGNFTKAVPIYNQLMNLEPFNPGVLYLMGDAAVRQGCNGLAINLLSNAISIKPTPESFTALGCAYKAEGYTDEAVSAWTEGLKLQPGAELHNNIASVYADAGRPALAHEHIKKALSFDPDNPNALWNRALANLTERNWHQGWVDHESRFDRLVQTISTRRDYGCPAWDGRPNVRLAIHGEQGIGDEIMFLSMLPDVLKLCPDVVVEVEPRLMDVVERSFMVPTYGNEKAMKAHEKPFEMAIPLGSLGLLLRQQDSDFPGKPYMVADPDRVQFWRRQYAMQGPGPYIGVAWQGGTKSTRITERTIRATDLLFTKRGTAVSLQYGEGVKATANACGFLFYPESVGQDMDETFAMAAACDVIVTVAQTMVHVAGALGVPCHALVPKYSSWRYGMTDSMPWYGSVRLHRQATHGEWGQPLASVKREIDKLCSKG